MDKKYKIGLIYGRNSNWIAGTYYIENLVFALKNVSSQTPTLKIYTESCIDFEYLKELTQYPDLICVLLKDYQNVFDKIINKISFVLFKKHWIVKGVDNEVDVLFPADDTYYFDHIKTKLHWIPDFQEKHYPHYFPNDELYRRESRYKRFISNRSHLVLSSNNALKDFSNYYAIEKANTYVMPFAVTLPELQGLNPEEVKIKYGISNQFFICSNQFWAHKNHQVVLEAISKLKEQGIDISVVFTGIMNDTRNPGYIDELKTQISENNIKENVKFLGFVDRKEQLILMKESLAIIQPSKFEGWSTVVEDAKALNQPIILSDLAIHKEQLPGYKHFFETNKSSSLMEQILLALQEKMEYPNVNYSINVKKFGEKFLDIITEVIE